MNNCSVWCHGEEGRGNGWWVSVGFRTRRSTELTTERSGVMCVRSILMYAFWFDEICGIWLSCVHIS